MKDFKNGLVTGAVIYVLGGLAYMFVIVFMLASDNVQAATVGSIFGKDTMEQGGTIPSEAFFCMEEHTCMFDLDGKFHHDKQPALVTPNGQYWLTHGLLNRVDGPAIVYRWGGKEWWQMGKLHRTDGPAVELIDGTKEWWFNGKFMRTE